MKLDIGEKVLRVKLNPIEMILTMRGSLDIPLKNIKGASTEKPGREWGARAPGTYIPFIIKAGTYLFGTGKEFWFTTIGKPYLVIETEGWSYRKVVLTMDGNKEWAERINGAVQEVR